MHDHQQIFCLLSSVLRAYREAIRHMARTAQTKKVVPSPAGIAISPQPSRPGMRLALADRFDALMDQEERNVA